MTALRIGRLVATDGESRLAAAAFAARGVDFGVVRLAPVDVFAAHQLAVVETLLPVGGLAVVDAARWAALAAGGLTALLLWPLVRRLELGTVPAAVAVAIAGVFPTGTLLHSGIGAGGLAALWLVAAALCAGAARRGALPAVVLALVAVATAPLAGAALLAMGGYLVASRQILSRLGSAARVVVALVLGVAALALGFAATGDRPLAGSAGPGVALPVAFACAALGAALLAVCWVRVMWLRPLILPAGLLLVALVVPGPSRATAGLLALPMVAIAAAAAVAELLDAAPLRGVGGRIGGGGGAGVRPAWLLRTAAVAGLLVAVVAGLLPVTGPAPPPAPALVAWITTDLAPGTLVRADALDRAELVADGLPPERLRDSAAPAAPADVVVMTSRPSVAGPTAQACPPSAVLAMMARGTGGAPAVVCSGDPVAAQDTDAELPQRVRLGSALADNPSVDIRPDAVTLLRDGNVDARLVIVLAALSSGSSVTVAGFPAGPLDPPGAPRRRVLITAVGGVPVGNAPLDMVRNWFGGQKPPFQPVELAPTPQGLLVGFSVPAPDGLLPE